MGTGKPLRQFMYAGDLARVIKEVIDKNISESFNVACPENYSIDELANQALGVLGKNLYIKYSRPELDGQFRKDVSCSKMLDILPTFKFTSYKEGIKKVYDNFSKRYNR